MKRLFKNATMEDIEFFNLEIGTEIYYFNGSSRILKLPIEKIVKDSNGVHVCTKDYVFSKDDFNTDVSFTPEGAIEYMRDSLREMYDDEDKINNLIDSFVSKSNL